MCLGHLSNTVVPTHWRQRRASLYALLLICALGVSQTAYGQSSSGPAPPSNITTAGLYSAGTTSETATTTAISGSVGGTAAVTVNAAASTPLYLSNLTFNSATITGGNSTIGTVTLSSPAPAGGVMVSLLSNSNAAAVPATCPVAAGATQATFTVTTTAVSAYADATISGTYGGLTQGEELGVLPSSQPSNPSPGMPAIQVASGNGCAVVAWTPSPAGTVSGYNVYRTSGGTKTRLTSTPFTSNCYPDVGLANDTTSYSYNDTTSYSYQVAAVDTQGQEQALSAPVSVTPSSATVTLNWVNPPSSGADNLALDVSLSSGGQVYGTMFFIDGVLAGAGGDVILPVNGVQTHIAGSGYDSTKLSNGPHTVQFLGFADANRTVAGVTPPITIQVNNTISSFHVDNSAFDPTQGELCYIHATASAGSTWTVQATNQDGSTTFRTWQGASSLVNLAWDGKDAAGNVVPFTDYSIQLTVQPPAGSPQATRPIGANSVPNATLAAAPDAAGTSKKTRPVSPQHGQPVALALMSIGASYYLDSNNLVEANAEDAAASRLSAVCANPNDALKEGERVYAMAAPAATQGG